MNLSKIVLVFCITLLTKSFSVFNQSFQGSLSNNPNDKYTIMVNKSFYQEFTDVFLTASNQEISLLLNPDPQSIEEYFENTNVLLKFYVIRYEEFKNLQIQFQEGKLNGSLPIEIYKNEKFVLVWNGEPDIPNKIKNQKAAFWIINSIKRYRNFMIILIKEMAADSFSVNSFHLNHTKDHFLRLLPKQRKTSERNSTHLFF